MRISTVVFSVLLSLSMGACNSTKARSDVPVAHGDYLLSAHTLNGNEATSVRLGGKVFHVNKSTISWEGGSAPLREGWGLLEMVESPSSILVNLDGVQVAEVAK